MIASFGKRSQVTLSAAIDALQYAPHTVHDTVPAPSMRLRTTGANRHRTRRSELS